MKKDKPAFTLVKVVDPHSNMPKKIKEAFFDALSDWELSNNSYINWSWETGASEDSSTYNKIISENFKAVNDWLLESGFKLYEPVMILYWW